MPQIKTNKYLLLYKALILIFGLFLTTISVKAQTTIKLKSSDTVYELEINSKPNFEEIKREVLLTDVNYVVFPNKLQSDVKLSEIVAGDIDYSSSAVQEIDFEVQRYTESMKEKTKIDTVAGKVKIRFIDTTPPEISLKQKTVTITEGDKLNVNDYLLEVTDNSFDEVSVHIDNPVNINKPGTYKVVYKATDSSENISEKVLTVTVKAKPKPKPVVKTTYRAPVSSAAVSNDYYGALSLINSHRAAAGLHPLQLGGSKEQSAVALRAAEAAGYVSHQRPDGRHYKTAFTDLGLFHNNVIENLTYSGSTAAHKVAWWMSSPGHRAALMRRDVTHIALGSSGSMWAAIVYR